MVGFRPVLSAVVLLALFCVGGLRPSAAHDYKIGAIKIDHPWTRVTPQGAKVAGGFMTITNTGSQPDVLVGGTFPLAGLFQVHEMKVDGGMMKMNELAGGLVIAPGAKVELKPGSYHVMFMDLKKPIEATGTIKGTLIFKTAGTIDIEYKIEPIGTKSSGGAADDHSGHGADHSAGPKK